MTMVTRIIFALTISLFTLCSQASITIGGTRLVYNGENNEASISVTNGKDSMPYLVQSWVEMGDDSSQKAPFIVTPPLFRLDGGHENALRVIYTGNTPLRDDRESMFWLNIKSIPSMEKSEQNKLLIAIKTRMKLFYRPASLNTNEAMNAWRKLNFRIAGNQLVIENPTPYFVSLFSLKIGSQKIKLPPMVPPFASATVEGSGKEIAWKAINDFGGISEEARRALP